MAINSDTPVYAAVAPAIAGQFKGLPSNKIRNAFKALGFTDVVEVAVGADPVDSRTPKASKPLAEAATALRQTYRKQLAAIMAQDTTAEDPIEIQPRISQELSDLADAALEGALAIARNEVDGSEHVRFAIIGMGKLGARELNYVSDVDLIYVVEPADADTNGMTLNLSLIHI